MFDKAVAGAQPLHLRDQRENRLDTFWHEAPEHRGREFPVIEEIQQPLASPAEAAKVWALVAQVEHADGRHPAEFVTHVLGPGRQQREITPRGLERSFVEPPERPVLLGLRRIRLDPPGRGPGDDLGQALGAPVDLEG